MTSLAKFNFKLTDLYPQSTDSNLNTCGNPDCWNFGIKPNSPAERKSYWQGKKLDLPDEQMTFLARHGQGSYKLAGADRKHRRTTKVLKYEQNPHAWIDQRTIRCQGLTFDDSVCNSGFSILSHEHLTEEANRLRNHNGVLDGPSCGACGTRFLECPEEFTMSGAHQRTKDRNGRPLKATGAPKAVRVLHKPCKGKKGARITISLPHHRQKTSKDNLSILNALINSAGILDVQRMLGSAAMGQKIGISRIYDRIKWFEQIFLAYEREMLRRWREKQSKKKKPVEHRLSHDDIVLSVNWETASDRRNTQLNCAITADADSGFVYRLDVDFDPNVAPLDLFNEVYLDEDGQPKNLSKDYPGTKFGSAPLFSWQRPTGRLHEPHFFAACVNEFRVFHKKAERLMPTQTNEQRAHQSEVLARVEGEINKVKLIGEDWFGFQSETEDTRGSFKGMTTRDTYTKAAHFILVKEMLPPGPIVLTTEQEATLPAILPHIFEEEIKRDQFTWLAMSFNKNAKKPEILRKVKEYRDQRWNFRNFGMYDGRFTLETDPQFITREYIRENMSTAVKPGKVEVPYPNSNYRVPMFPKLWIRSPTQASGELDKVVGFPIVRKGLRRQLKGIPFNATEFDEEVREELAELVFKATLQPASTFMNSLRVRLSAAERAGGGGARVGGSYIPGAVFNPRVLISLLNIFRVHYNFFELRPYATPYEEISTAPQEPVKKVPRALRIPGTDEWIDLAPKASKTPERKTPAMRHGMNAHTRRKTGEIAVPDLHRLIYRPWLYAGTKVGAKLDRTWGANRKPEAKPQKTSRAR